MLPVSLFLIKLQACNTIKKRLQRRCLPMINAKVLRAAFSIEHLWWLLLNFKFDGEILRKKNRNGKQSTGIKRLEGVFIFRAFLKIFQFKARKSKSKQPSPLFLQACINISNLTCQDCLLRNW